MRCLTYSFADKIDLFGLERAARLHGYKIEKHPHVLQIADPNNAITCHYFANGTVVIWSPFRIDYQRFLQLAQEHSESFLGIPIKDSFSFKYGDNMNIQLHDYFNVEVITLEDDEPISKLSLAFALSQSIKIKHFEHIVESLIAQYSPLIKQVSSFGKVSMSRKRIHQIFASIVETKSQINLGSDFFYPPKFFWQYPSLEESYLMLHKYLDIPERIRALNQKVDTLNDTFDMFNSYLDTRHSHFLEVIIIVLITIEIIFSILNFHL